MFLVIFIQIFLGPGDGVQFNSPLMATNLYKKSPWERATAVHVWRPTANKIQAHQSQQLSLDTIVFIHSLAYARWRYRSRSSAVVWAAESMHFKEALLYNAFIRRPP